MSLKYRPEIDGLRAVAVISVILFHAEYAFGSWPFFRGGYFGVDVFFVISGYLITSIILREAAAGDFSLAGFYERRARRILPALFVVVLASLPAAWLYLLPGAMKDYAASVISALFFGSNFWFWLEDPYFAEASAFKPFLHTWSLAVEEQFYVLYPLFLLAVLRFARNYLVGLMVLALLLSLQGAYLGFLRFPDAAFYLLPTRGWELLAGAVLAKLETDKGRISHPFLDATMPALGLFMLFYTFVIWDEGALDVDFVALVPVIGTMLLIWFTRPGELVSDLLSSRLAVGAGLISYSLYLWHFPVFAFARNATDTLSAMDKIGCIVLSVALSVATFFLIERPARNRKRLPRRIFVPTVITAFAVLLAAQTFIYRSDGLPSRAGPAQALFEGLVSNSLPEIVPDGYSLSPDNPNEITTAEAKGRLIATGDSHVGALRNALVGLAARHALNFTEINTPGCPPVLNARKFVEHKESDAFFLGIPNRLCNIDVQRQRVEAMAGLAPSLLIYSARFPLYFSGQGYDNGEGGVEPSRHHLMTPSPAGVADPEGMKKLVAQTIRTLLDQGHTVVLVYPVPEAGWNVPRMVNSLLRRVPVHQRMEELGNVAVATSYDRFKKRSLDAYDAFDLVGEHRNLIRVYPEELFCSQGGKCRTHDDKEIFYRDDNHLSVHGARLLVDKIENLLVERGHLK